jgi:hypothetical protein
MRYSGSGVVIALTFKMNKLEGQTAKTKKESYQNL